MTYRHTQIGWVVIGVVAFAGLVAATPLTMLGLTAVPIALLAVGLVVLASFSTLTVTVTDRQIEARFGVGLLRRRVPFTEVRSYRVVQNPWYYGWGLRFIAGGRLYNVSGLSAVELVLASGLRVRIGTDEPETLAVALGSKLGQAPSTVGFAPPQRSGLPSEAVVLLVVMGPVLFLVGTLIFLGLRPPQVTVSRDLLSVRSGLHGDEVALEDILDVSMEGAIPSLGRRRNGFALGATLRGRFELVGVDDARLFVQADTPPFVKVRTANKVLFIGFQDHERTERLYLELTGVWKPQ